MGRKSREKRIRRIAKTLEDVKVWKCPLSCPYAVFSPSPPEIDFSPDNFTTRKSMYCRIGSKPNKCPYGICDPEVTRLWREELAEIMLEDRWEAVSDGKGGVKLRKRGKKPEE